MVQVIIALGLLFGAVPTKAQRQALPRVVLGFTGRALQAFLATRAGLH